MNIDAVVEELRIRGYEVEVRKIIKNSVELIGIEFNDPDSNVRPVIYYSSLEGSVSEMADQAIAQYEKARLETFDVDSIINEEFFRKHLTVALQRQSEENLVKKAYMDEMEQYMILAFGMMSIKITSQHLEYVQMTEEDAWKCAMANCINSTEIELYNDFLAELMESAGIPEELKEVIELPEESPVAIIRSNGGMKGASGVLNTSLIRDYAIKRGTNRIAWIPSSIHEGLLIPMSEEDDIEIYSQMVRETNESCVDPTEQLADKAYVIEV